MFCNFNVSVKKEVRVKSLASNGFQTVQDAKAFVNDIISWRDDVDICSYVEMFIGAMYHHQQRIKTDMESKAVSVK